MYDIKDIIIYDPLTGLFKFGYRHSSTFKTKRAYRIYNTRFLGKEAFTTTDSEGYRRGKIFGKTYLAHRVAWRLCFGYWPTNYIDHINGDKTDNRIENLREATPRESAKNRKTRSNSKSPYKGVSWSAEHKKWRARICTDGKTTEIGLFDCDKEAARVIDKYVEGQHGEFGRPNFKEAD